MDSIMSFPLSINPQFNGPIKSRLTLLLEVSNGSRKIIAITRGEGCGAALVSKDHPYQKSKGINLPTLIVNEMLETHSNKDEFNTRIILEEMSPDTNFVNLMISHLYYSDKNTTTAGVKRWISETSFDDNRPLYEKLASVINTFRSGSSIVWKVPWQHFNSHNFMHLLLPSEVVYATSIRELGELLFIGQCRGESELITYQLYPSAIDETISVALKIFSGFPTQSQP